MQGCIQGGVNIFTTTLVTLPQLKSKPHYEDNPENNLNLNSNRAEHSKFINKYFNKEIT